MKTLDDILEKIAVIECDEMIKACCEALLPEDHPEGWWGVVNDDGVIAYFNEERRAFEYRLFLVNQILNGPQ